MAGQITIITTTVESHQHAEILSKRAVESGMAACAQVDSPITSHYRWKGEMEIATEYRIHFKTATRNKAMLVEWLMQQHPYDCPQILAWEAASGNPEYTRWVEQE